MGSVSKVIDSRMTNELTEKCNQYEIKNQNEFIKSRSMITYLIIPWQYISQSLKENKQIYFQYIFCKSL